MSCNDNDGCNTAGTKKYNIIFSFLIAFSCLYTSFLIIPTFFPRFDGILLNI